jgi:hypothetical protein
VITAAQLGCVVLCTHDDGHVPTSHYHSGVRLRRIHHKRNGEAHCEILHLWLAVSISLSSVLVAPLRLLVLVVVPLPDLVGLGIC